MVIAAQLMLLISLFSIFCFSTAKCDDQVPNDYFEFQQESKKLLAMFEEDKAKFALLDIENFKHTRIYLKDIYNGLLHDTQIVFDHNEYFLLFVGPETTFIVCQGGDNFRETIRPYSKIYEDGSFASIALNAKRKLFLGYYRPAKDTYSYKPLPPLAGDYVDIILASKKIYGTDSSNKIIKFVRNLIPDDKDYGEIVALNKNEVDMKIPRLKPEPRWEIPFFIFIWCLYFVWLFLWAKKTKNKFADIDKPIPGNSMRKLFKKGTGWFLCHHCGKPLKIYGKFECRAGHIPYKEKSIFSNCDACTDVHDKIRCEQCGHIHSLDAQDYNSEEIQNRGKPYIARTNPYVSQAGWLAGGVIVIFSFFLAIESMFNSYNLIYYQPQMLSEIYSFLYHPTNIFFHRPDHGNSVGFFFIAGSIFLLTASIILNQKKILIRNPYERK